MNDPRHADFDVDDANTRLVAGLKSCRSVVENYRAMLSGDQEADDSTSKPVNDFDPEQGAAP